LCGLYCPDFAIYGVRLKDIEALIEAKRTAQAAAE
jgi:hypothetical protein